MKIGALSIIALFAAGPATAKEITFTEHVAPIIFQHCTSCHRFGEAAPFTLTNYADTRKRGRLIARVTEDRIMPPWHAEKSSFAFHGDRRLTESQIGTIGQWVESGMPEGDRAKLPPLPKFPQGWQLGQPDLIVKMTQAYPVPAEGRDIYRKFVIPLNLTEDKWLKAIEFRPGARAVVHHSLFSYDTTGEARRLDAQDPEPGFRRMRGLNRGNTALGGWATGGQPNKLPADLAWRLPKNADLILAMHYHPSGKPERDQSTVGLYFTDKPPRTVFAGIQLPPNFGALSRINIPPGEKAYTVTDRFTLPADIEAFAVSAHAHYLGKHLRMTATLPDGKTLDLLNIPDWDFSWQEQYQFTDFIRLPKGTELKSTVVWDNSADNPNNPAVPPRRVRFGPESEDEMGSLTLQFRPAPGASFSDLVSAYRQHVRQVSLKPNPPQLSQPDPQAHERGHLIITGIIQRSDKNGNRQLDRGEEPAWLKGPFNRLDTNSDNALDHDELMEALKRLRPSP